MSSAVMGQTGPPPPHHPRAASLVRGSAVAGKDRSREPGLVFSGCVTRGTHSPSLSPGSSPLRGAGTTALSQGHRAPNGPCAQKAPRPGTLPPGLALTFGGFVHRVPELEAGGMFIPQLLQLGPQQDVLLRLQGQGQAVRGGEDGSWRCSAGRDQWRPWLHAGQRAQPTRVLETPRPPPLPAWGAPTAAARGPYASLSC